jgi:hypothetical protein
LSDHAAAKAQLRSDRHDESTHNAPVRERFAKHAGMRKAAEASGRSVQSPPMTISHSPGLS